MKIAYVNSGDILDKEKNPTLCMSALRYTGGCLECLKRTLQMENYDLEKVLSKVLCNPIISEDMLRLYKEKERMQKEKRILQARIDEVDIKLGLQK